MGLQTLQVNAFFKYRARKKIRNALETVRIPIKIETINHRNGWSRVLLLVEPKNVMVPSDMLSVLVEAGLSCWQCSRSHTIQISEIIYDPPRDDE